MVINVHVAQSLSDDNRTLTIRIIGHFNYKIAKEFHASYSNTFTSNLDYLIDLRLTKHVDSSALGMPICMYKALPCDSTVSIINCSLRVKKILSCSGLSKIFDIS